MNTELEKLQRDAEMISRFAVALYRTGHEQRARQYAQMANRLWRAWVMLKEAAVVVSRSSLPARAAGEGVRSL